MVDFNKAAETKNIVVKMLAEGYSQVEVGRRLGISRGQIYNIKSGRTGAGIKSIESAERSKSIKHEMRLLRSYGSIAVQPANMRERSKIGNYWNAIKTARREGDWSKLKIFEGKYIIVIDKGKRERLYFVTDPKELKRLEDEAQLEPITIAYERLKNVKRRRAVG